MNQRGEPASGSTFFRVAALVAVAAYGFWPALRGGWIWDDNVGIAENPLYSDPAGWRQMWFHPQGADYFPLKDMVQWMEWRWWGPSPAAFHATSLVLHAASALLLWAILRRLFPATADGALAAWGGGLLFSIHPLTVESVAWLSELKNTLSLALVLASALTYLHWDERRSWRSYGAALLFFAAALLAKTSVVMVPGALLLYAVWRRGRLSRRDLIGAAPFFALSFGLGLVTIRFQHAQLAYPDGPPLGGFAAHWATAGLAIVFYVGKFLLPVPLLMIYPQWPVVPAHAAQFLPWVGLLAAAGWLWSRRRAGWAQPLVFGLGFFLLNLAPVLGFIRMSFSRFSGVADHFAYLPMIGLVGLTAAAFGAGLSRLAGPGRVCVIGTAAVGLLALASLTRSQAALFSSPTALWTHTLRSNPQAWVAEYEIGSEFYEHQSPAEAIPHFEAALQINPRLSEAENALGAAFALTGRPAEGLRHIARALELYPTVPKGRYNLGTTLMRLGRYGEAVPQFQAAARAAPRGVEIWSNLGLAQAHLGRLDDAAASYRTALQIDPEAAPVHDNLGYTELMRGRGAAAAAEFERALQLQPADPEAHLGLGNALMTAHQPEQAIAHYAEALRLRPDFPAARHFLELARQEAGSKP